MLIPKRYVLKVGQTLLFDSVWENIEFALKLNREIVKTGRTLQSTVLLGLRKVKDRVKVVKLTWDEKALSGNTAKRYLLTKVTLVAWYVLPPIVMLTTDGTLTWLQIS